MHRRIHGRQDILSYMGGNPRLNEASTVKTAFRPGDSGHGETTSRDRPRRGQGRRLDNGDPVTTDRLYAAAEAEWLLAVERYKRESNRPFPTLAELLAVLLSLGYRKTEPAAPLPRFPWKKSHRRKNP